MVEADKDLIGRLDEIYTTLPFYGYRRLTAQLRREGWVVNGKKVLRLMHQMGLKTMYPKRHLVQANETSETYPYLLREVEIDRCNQVWSTDITYIPVKRGWAYLTAVMDWYSRYVLSWKLSNTMDTEFCVTALQTALRRGLPEIFNSDQGSQFKSKDFTEVLKAEGIQISMDGKGRALDNIFVERLWRTVKYEEVYLKEYETVREAEISIGKYFEFYNQQRLHQALGYKTPEEVYFSKPVKAILPP